MQKLQQTVTLAKEKKDEVGSVKNVESQVVLATQGCDSSQRTPSLLGRHTLGFLLEAV